MLRSGGPLLIGTVLALLVFAGCQDTKVVEVVNSCSQRVVVNLWETPRPRGAKSDRPARVVVPALAKVEVKDALADVGDDGSSAEIVSGPGAGEVLFIPHGGDLVVIIPGKLCGEAA